ALGEHFSFMQDGHRVGGDAAHEIHVVLDHRHSVLTSKLAQEFCGAFNLLVSHACNGFIYEKNTRILRKEHADLEPLLLSMSESTGPSCGELAQSYFFKHNIAALSLFVGEWLIEATPDPLFRGESQLNILAYRMLRKHGRSLKLSTDPLPGDLVFGADGQVFQVLQEAY